MKSCNDTISLLLVGPMEYQLVLLENGLMIGKLKIIKLMFLMYFQLVGMVV
jgi:hypothetical protein